MRIYAMKRDEETGEWEIKEVGKMSDYEDDDVGDYNEGSFAPPEEEKKGWCAGIFVAGIALLGGGLATGGIWVAGYLV